MLENELMSLVRSTLQAHGPLAGVQVFRKLPKDPMGAPAAPTVFTQQILTVPYGHRKREYLQPVPPSELMTYRDTQYYETTVQVSATARRSGDAGPTAYDLCRFASDALICDPGLELLAAQAVRPLRVTTIRDVPFVNDSAQNEDNPSFDVVLCHVQITESTTTAPVAVFEPLIGRV